MPTFSLRHLAVTLLPGVALLGTPLTGQADGYVEFGVTSESTPAVTLGMDRMFSLAHWHPQLELRLGTGLMLLPGDDGHDNAAWVVTPAFRWTFAGERGVFAEAGVGTALFLERHVEDSNLGSAFQFEDRLAIGLPFAGGELGASLIHYSNAGITNPNDGFEVFAVSYRHRF